MSRQRDPAQLKNRLEIFMFRNAKRLRQWFRGRPPLDRKNVVFISGVQRSGTNMMINVLHRSPLTEVFRESDPRAYRGFELRDTDVLRRHVESSQGQTVVFKALCELQRLGALMDGFPRARSLWILRRVEDMVNSHLRAWPEQACDRRMREIVSGRDRDDWRGRGVGEVTISAIRGFVHDRLDHESAVALFWLMRNRLYFDQGLDQDARVRVVFYEDLVQEPDRYGAALLKWLDLPPLRSATRKVSPRSIGRNPPPAIEAPILEECHQLYDRFRREARLLTPLTPS